MESGSRAAVVCVVLLAGTLAVLATACGSPQAGSRTDGRRAAAAHGGGDDVGVDAGAVRACTHDARDLTPCLEDCDRGIAIACGVAAERLEHGHDVPRDPSRASALHERACELRDAAGCTAAARMYARGIGVRADRTRQLHLLARACVLGDGLACALPARAYAAGRDGRDGADPVPADPRKAAELWQHACLAGIVSACDALADAGG